MERGSWAELCALTCDPNTYETAAEFAIDYMSVEILSKYPFENKDADRTSIALDKFRESETFCTSSNMRLWRSSHGGLTPAMWPAVQHTARRNIERVLGPFISEEAELRSSFGPGATTSLRRNRGDTYHKFGHLKPDTTYENAFTARDYVFNIPRWWETLTGALPEDRDNAYLDWPVERLFNIVPGNRVTTVPKNYKTERVIGIEPDMNMYVQKGIGACISSRLRRVGVNLKDQTLNQRRARLGSIYGHLATIDLSSASDTICVAIVESLLPDDWVAALKQSRSPRGVLPSGDSVLYRKFSSMGNGYTFELESLIFWALCSAVVDLEGHDGITSVYGDDIIVPTKSYPTVKEILTFAGFTCNEKKTFSDGPFRESCGKHYFKGCDVTPPYIRERPVSWTDYVALANKLRRHARMSYGLDSSYRKAYEHVIAHIPPYFRNKIPDQLGDLGLVSDFDEATPSYDRGIQAFHCSILLQKGRSTGWEGYPYLLRQLQSKERNGEEVLQSPTRLLPVVQGKPWPYRRVLKSVEQWPSFGPWI